MRKSVLLLFLLFVTVKANAATLFFDDFNSGLSSSGWNLEQMQGVTWVSGTDGDNGYAVSQSQMDPDWSKDRYLDMLSNDQSFSDFLFTFNIKFNNNSYHSDWRRIYFRAQGGIDDYQGYCINIRNWSGEGYDFVGLGPYKDFTLDAQSGDYAEYFNPLATGEWYHFKVLALGNNLRLKYWLASETEPNSWLIDVLDPQSRYTTGGVGFGNYWWADTYVDNVKVSAVPEPASLSLFGLGLAGLVFSRRKK